MEALILVAGHIPVGVDGSDKNIGATDFFFAPLGHGHGEVPGEVDAGASVIHDRTVGSVRKGSLVSDGGVYCGVGAGVVVKSHGRIFPFLVEIIEDGPGSCFSIFEDLGDSISMTGGRVRRQVDVVAESAEFFFDVEDFVVGGQGVDAGMGVVDEVFPVGECGVGKVEVIEVAVAGVHILPFLEIAGGA